MFNRFGIAIVLLLICSGCTKVQPKSNTQLAAEAKADADRSRDEVKGEKHFENIKAIMEGDGQALTREVKQ